VGDPAFEAAVAEQVQRLGGQPLTAVARAQADRRRAWSPVGPAIPDRPKTPRAAFQLFLLDYLGLDPRDVPIVSETDDEIVWLSKNRCPTLDACRRLALDTRVVCRAVYEKPTQVLLSRLDPRLRFLRDYGELRPRAEHCKERIVRVGFEAMMRVAIEEAKLSRGTGNKGYGAVVAIGTDILARAHDTAASERDPSLHAEVNAIRRAVRVLGDSNLSGAILFSSCEPCPMCASLAVWANVSAIVYGASINDAAGLGKDRIRVSAQEIVERSPALVEVVGGVLEKECLALCR
jgi:tRNA(adenine34) deaminase